MEEVDVAQILKDANVTCEQAVFDEQVLARSVADARRNAEELYRISEL